MRISFGILFQNYSIFVFRSDNIQFNDNINSFGDILEQYMKWDANNYVRIATGGYTYYTEGENFTLLHFFRYILGL